MNLHCRKKPAFPLIMDAEEVDEWEWELEKGRNLVRRYRVDTDENAILCLE